MSEAAVRASGLSKSFPTAFGLRRRTALASIDLEVRFGEAVALLGPNGSGKSTLLRVLAGVEGFDAGTVSIAGFPAGSRAACLRIGYCPEEAPFPAHLPARTCLLDLGRLSGLGGADLRRRADRVLDELGLAAEATTRAGRLSRGQGRRLSIAQALLHDPDILLLDEPTSGLDALGSVALERCFGEARRRGAAILLSSHFATDVDRLCERAVVLREGKKVADGPADELFSLPGRALWEVDGLAADRSADAARAIEPFGARVVRTAPARRSLAEIFRQWLR